MKGNCAIRVRLFLTLICVRWKVKEMVSCDEHARVPSWTSQKSKSTHPIIHSIKQQQDLRLLNARTGKRRILLIIRAAHKSEPLSWFGWDRAHFSLAAGPVLCFGFSMRIRLATHKCFGCAWVGPMRSQGQVSVSKEVHKKLRGSTATTADPNWLKGYFNHHTRLIYTGGVTWEKFFSVWEEFGIC